MFEGDIPYSLDEGVSHSGFEVEVVNVLGAGDGFMAGLLAGWLTGKEWAMSLEIANACGAFAVSRHGCTPSYPSPPELKYFLNGGVITPALGDDHYLEQIHWATTRTRKRSRLAVLDLTNLEVLDVPGSGDVIDGFKNLCLDALQSLEFGFWDLGIISDNHSGRSVLSAATGLDLWAGRPCMSANLEMVGEIEPLGTFHSNLDQWPITNTVIFDLHVAVGEDDRMESLAVEALRSTSAAARRNSLEFAIDLVGSQDDDEEEVVRLIDLLLNKLIIPDWWIIKPGRQWGGVDGIVETARFGYQSCPGLMIRSGSDTKRMLEASTSDAMALGTGIGIVIGASCGQNIARRRILGRLDDTEATLRLADRFSEEFGRFGSDLFP